MAVARCTTMSLLLTFVLVAAASPSRAEHACIKGLGMENAQVWWTGSNNSKYLVDFTTESLEVSNEDIGQTPSIETTAVYTTAGGELLLYTDGDVVFDGRTHTEIGRGVGGNPSSTEAALIVPVPEGDPRNDFYIFGNTASTRGPIQYSRVDIGAGTIDDVVSLENGLVFGESLGTVPHANGIDFWILSVSWEDPALHAYLITSDGVSSSAIRSKIPGQPDPSNKISANRGSVVYHPPSGRLAITFYSEASMQSLLYTAEFDEATGEAADFKGFELGGYGVAFSPDGNKLYFGNGYSGELRQLDPDTGETHRIALGSWAMPRLAPDGKVYVVGYRRTSMGVIDNPNAEFDALVWDPEGVELPGGASTAYSLPNQVYAPCIVNYPDEIEQQIPEQISEQVAEDGQFSVVIADSDDSTERSAMETLEIVLDMSGSMWGQIEGRAKYDIAREIVATTVRELPDEMAVGVRVYSHRSGDCRDSELLAPIGTADRMALADRVAELRPGEGKTPIGYSLEQVANDLAGQAGRTAILLVSDGLETCNGNPVAAAEKLCAAGVGIKVHTVGFDIDGEPEAVAQLKAVAEAGCGRFVSAADAGELQQALQKTTRPTFTLSASASGETRTGAIGAEAIVVPAGTYRLTIEDAGPLDLGEIEIAPGARKKVELVRTAEGFRRSRGD